MAQYTTTAEFLAALRLVLQEPEAGGWTDAQLIGYLNDAVKEDWSEFISRAQSGDMPPYTEESTAYNLVDGTEEYALPSDCMRFVALERVYDSDYQDFMTKKSLRDRGRYRNDTTVTSATLAGLYPSMYYLRRNYFGIIPIPTENLTAAVVVHYVPWLDDMTAGAAWTELSSRGVKGLDRAIVLRAAMIALHLDETQNSGVVAEHASALQAAVSAISDDWEEIALPDPPLDKDW